MRKNFRNTLKTRKYFNCHFIILAICIYYYVKNKKVGHETLIKVPFCSFLSSSFNSERLSRYEKHSKRKRTLYDMYLLLSEIQKSRTWNTKVLLCSFLKSSSLENLPQCEK